MADEKLTYSTAEAAAMIPCGESWLIDQLRAGRFPGVKIQRKWRMTRADIEAAVEACHPQPKDDPDYLDTACNRRRAAREAK